MPGFLSELNCMPIFIMTSSEPVRMASDEEIARHVRRQEREHGWGGRGESTKDELKEHRETASEVHDELARRIQRVDDAAASEDDLAAVVEKLEEIEARLDDLEGRL